jgi:serine phosphatase RsbU (regulator of sigma subunit)
LEKRVEERTIDISIANKALREEINEKAILSLVLEKKNKDITDSINYAKRIQRSFLPKDEKFGESFNDYFILNLPKAVVSGDFYWLENVNTTPVVGEGTKVSVISVVDCTGHGIPGALVSIVGNTLLNQTIKNKDVNSPADALNFLNRELPKNLKKQNNDDEIRDGMDMVVCAIDHTSGKLHFSGANNSIYIISNNKLSIIHGEHQPISASESEFKKEFTTTTFDIQKGDCVYLFTDGYVDQFGGEKGKKFKHRQLQDLLLANAHLTMSEQQQILNDAMEKWKGEQEQVDDILVIGIRL